MAKTVTLSGQRIEHEGNVWHIDGKARDGVLTVSGIHGDITSPDLKDALQATADAIGLADALAIPAFLKR